MHYYQFNIGDYHSHTEHLDAIEDIAYRRMLDWCYLHESALPLDVEDISVRIRMRSHSDSIAYVLREFFVLEDDGWNQDRIKKEVTAYHSKSDKAKASAKARWSKKPNKINKKDDDANALRTECESNAKHKTLTTKQEPSIKDFAPYGFDLTSWPDLPSDEVWADFVKHRKYVKAKLSQTAINRMTKKLFEMQSKGWSVNDVLSTVCEKGWKSFEVEWLLKEQPNKQRSLTDLMNDQSISI